MLQWWYFLSFFAISSIGMVVYIKYKNRLKFLRLWQYYLKARFHFNKDQFADLMVISGVAGTISQVFSYTAFDSILINVQYCFLLFLWLTLFDIYILFLVYLILCYVQLLLMPLLAPILGEEKLLSIGLVFNFSHVSVSVSSKIYFIIQRLVF